MEAVKVKNLSFRYPGAVADALNSISFSVNSGEFITVCGPSGCGKSTLLRHLKPALTPHGERTGEIFFEGKPIENLTSREQSSKIGFVLQSPENQIVTDKVWHELAFGLENLGEDNSSIRRKVAETASFFGLHTIFEKKVCELSGGQKQLLNLAAVMAMSPSVLILDEPTSQLDPIAASEFLACISKINRGLGTTIIITEHRLEEVLPLSSRVLVIENGKLISDAPPEKTGENLKELDSKTFLSLPSQMQIWHSVDDKGSSCPVTVAKGREWLSKYASAHKTYELYEEEKAQLCEPSVELKDVWFRYEKDSPDVIRGASLTVYKGEFLAILGGNGTGKSTALSLINSINKPYRGKIRIFDADISKSDSLFIATLPQNPKDLFVKKTVKEDLSEIFDGINITKQEKDKRLAYVIKLCRLQNLLERHPYDLSGGEQQRAALAKVLLLQPKILLLDEPTKGIDAEFKIILAEIIRSLKASSVTVIMVSHDVEFCAKYPDRCVMFFNGEIVSQDSPRRFFAENNFYSTTASRISKGIFDSAVTADDVIYCCTGKKSETKKTDKFVFPDTNSENIPDEKISNEKLSKEKPLWKKILTVFSAVLLLISILISLDCIKLDITSRFEPWSKYIITAVPVILLMLSAGGRSSSPCILQSVPSDKRRLPRRTVAALIVILLLIPLTIFVGTVYLQNKKYLFISLLVMLECMLPFFLVFEGRKPQARELVIIAALCAIGVAGRTAFYFLPQFKPVIALIIISAATFGAESGFLVGAVTMLVSNIMFMQGPWTPWQMFAAGIIGFLAGLLCSKGILARSRASLCMFGFIATVLIYGVLMNISTVFTAQAAPSLELIMTYCISGLPFDIVHGLSTVAFLFFAAEPMLEKLNRIKTKYGLIR